MNTITSVLRLMDSSNLSGRSRIFEDSFGVKVGHKFSTINTDLVTPIKLSAISNFIMVSTDTPVELVLTQIENADRMDVKLNTIVLPVTGLFVTYSRIQQLEIRRVEGGQRVPKMTIIYA